MEPIPRLAELSTRRSRNRLRVLLALASVGEAYVGQLARMTGLRRHRVLGALVGEEPDYRPSLSLVRTGLVEERRDEHGRSFAVTTRGLRKARSLLRRLRTPRADGAVRLLAPDALK